MLLARIKDRYASQTRNKTVLSRLKPNTTACATDSNLRSRLLCSLIISASLFLLLSTTLLADPLPVKIVFSNDGHTNPYHVEWLSSFEAALTAYNKKFGGIDGHWISATRIEKQFEQINAEIDKGVDILFVNAMSVEALMPLVAKAQNKGIIWVAVHNNIEAANYNFVLGDFENGYNQGLALATYFNGKANVAVMLGMRANTSGEARQHGIVDALRKFPDINIVAQEPADWSISKALNVATKWYKQYPDLDAISVVTDTYLYPAIQVAEKIGLGNLTFFGHDGDKKILQEMKSSGRVKANILLSANREGWAFVQFAYKIIKNMPMEKNYNFHTPLVLSPETYATCIENGFPEDIEVYSIEQALKVSDNAEMEFGPDSIQQGDK